MRLLYCYVHFLDEEGIPAPFRGLEKLEFNFSIVDRFSYDIETNTLTRKDRTYPLPENFWSDDLSQKTNIYNVNVISGKNGSGKTTAIHYLIDLLDSIHAAADPMVKDNDRMVKRGVAGNRTLLLLEEAGKWYLIDYVPLGWKRVGKLQIEGFDQKNLRIFHSWSWRDFWMKSKKSYTAISALMKTKVIFMTNALSQHDYERNLIESNERLRDGFVYDASIGSTIGPDIAQFFPYEVYKQVCYVFNEKQAKKRLAYRERIPELIIPHTLRLRPRTELLKKLFSQNDYFSSIMNNRGLPGQLRELCTAAFIENLDKITEFDFYKVIGKVRRSPDIRKAEHLIIDAEERFNRMLTIVRLEGHASTVNCISVTLNGLCVSGSDDHTLRVWDLRSGKCLHILRGHSDTVTCVVATPRGLCVTGSKDNNLRVWNPRSGKCLHILRGHSSWVTCVAVTTNDLCISGSVDHTLCVWDLRTGSYLRTLPGHSRRVTCLTITADGLCVSGSDDSTLRVWNLYTKKCIHVLEGHDCRITCVAVTADSLCVSGSEDSTLRVWDLRTGGHLHTLKGHSRRVTCVTITADGLCVSGSEDNTLRVWNLRTGDCLHTLEGHKGYVTCVTVNSDGLCTSGSDDKTVRVWDLNSYDLNSSNLKSYKSKYCSEEQSSGITCVAILPDGSIISGDCNGNVILDRTFEPLNETQLKAQALRDACLDYVRFLDKKSNSLFSRFQKIDDKTFELSLDELEMLRSKALEKSEEENRTSEEAAKVLYRDLIAFLQKYIQTCKPTYTIDFDWGMSSGEENMLRLFSNLYHVFDPNDRNGDGFIYNNESHSEDERQRTKCDSVLLFLDEADLTLHPEWQRRLILILTAFLPQLFPPKCVKDMQVILSTHSPLLLGDIPGENITYLPAKKRTDANKNEKNGEGNTEHWETFGENIHTILKESFFLSNGTVGAFAARRINYIAQRLNWIRLQAIDTTNSEWRQSLKEELQTLKQGIDIVAPGVLRARLEQLYRIAEAALRPREETEIDMDKLLATVKRLPPEARQQLITLLNKGE